MYYNYTYNNINIIKTYHNISNERKRGYYYGMRALKEWTIGTTYRLRKECKSLACDNCIQPYYAILLPRLSHFRLHKFKKEKSINIGANILLADMSEGPE